MRRVAKSNDLLNTRPWSPLQPLSRLYATRKEDLIRTLLRNPELCEEDARNELRWIKQAVQDANSIRYIARSSVETDTKDVKRITDAVTIEKLVDRRSKGEPLQYVLGTTDFGPLELLTRPPVLIPRPETAYITAQLSSTILASPSMHTCRKPLRILDLCSGSGCIALLLAHQLGDHASIRGVDISPDAIQLARENAVHTGLSDRVAFDLGNLWADTVVTEKVDIVVSNPPYIPRTEWETLSPSVTDFEDPTALVGDPEDTPLTSNHLRNQRGGVPVKKSDGKGLAFYRRIATILPQLLDNEDHLMTGQGAGLSRVAVEIGAGQAQDVQQILCNLSSGLVTRTEVWNDQYGVDRMVVGYS